MLKIAICDNNVVSCSEMEQYILNYQKYSNVKFEIKIFYCGENLLNFIKKEHSFDLIFLEIELVTITGIEVGRNIREEFNDYICKIVFISATAEYNIQLFALQTFYFLEKPICKETLINCIKIAIKVFDLDNKTFEYQIGREIKKVPIKNILYFEKELRKIKIVTISDTNYFNNDLKHIKDKLPKTFISPHISFIVNCNYIEKILYNIIYIMNGEIIPISKRNIKTIRKYLIETD